jgi:hypothetical protein
MRQISKLLFILTTIILFSCSSGRQVVYRDCDCDRTTLSFGWGYNDPFWGWNNPYRWNNPYWGWNNPYRWNDPYLGWYSWNWVRPQIVRPNTPSRYDRRQTIGERPSRNGGMESSPSRTRVDSRTQDNLYFSRPSRVESQSRPNYQYNQPSNRTESPTRSRVESQSTPSRVESSRPNRSYTPQVQQKTSTPNTNTQGGTPSRRGSQNNQEK